MSIEAMVWALNKAPVTDSAALLVLLGLANHADSEGKDAFPSRETLSLYARCSVRTVAVKLKALEDGGIIRRGDQQKLAHLRPDRRPVNWDLNYDVQNLPPVGSGYDVQTEVERGAESGNTAGSPASNGVQTSAHKPSITSHEPSIEVERVETSAPTAPATQLEPVQSSAEPVMDAEANHITVSIKAVQRLFPGVTWHPSREIWERARVLYPEVDLGKVVIEYIQKNHRNKQSRPDETQWLSWCAQAHKQHTEAALRIKAEQQANHRSPNWYTVAD